MYEVYDTISGESLYVGTHEEAIAWLTEHEWDDEYASARMRIRSAS